MDGYVVSKDGIRAYKKLNGGLQLQFNRWEHADGTHHQSLHISAGTNGVVLREDRRTGANSDIVFGHVNGVYNTDLYTEELKGINFNSIKYEIDGDNFIINVTTDKIKQILKKNKITFAVVVDPFDLDDVTKDKDIKTLKQFNKVLKDEHTGLQCKYENKKYKIYDKEGKIYTNVDKLDRAVEYYRYYVVKIK